jgi:hypothetical protein
MKRVGQIIGAAIVGIVCVCMLPFLIPLIMIYTVFAVIRAMVVAFIKAIKAKADKP